MKGRWAVLLVALLAVACSPITAATTTTTVPAAVTTAAAPPATTTTRALAAPPWASAPLSQDQVPAALVTQWGAAGNRATCAGLALVGGVEGATPRAANFSGGWAVAWDAPDGPGMQADGTFCEDCGRSVVGVAGAGITAEGAPIANFPNVISWSDGSVIGVGPEGQVGDLPVTDPLTEGAVSPTLIGFLQVAGQDCLYNIWDRRGNQAAILDVINRLRFVEGLGGP